MKYKDMPYPDNLIYQAYEKEFGGVLIGEESSKIYMAALETNREEIGKRVDEIVKKMKPSYQEVINSYFCEKKSQKKIAEERGVTATNIQRMLANTYRDLRKGYVMEYVFNNTSEVHTDSLNGLLSTRTYNSIRRAGIKDLESLANFAKARPVYLSRIRNMGRGSLDEIETLLKSQGLIPLDFHVKAYKETTEVERAREKYLCSLEDKLRK